MTRRGSGGTWSRRWTGTAGRAGPLLGPPAPWSFAGLVTALINDLAAQPGGGEVLLVLDDYHLIDTQPVHESLMFLLEHLGAGETTWAARLIEQHFDATLYLRSEGATAQRWLAALPAELVQSRPRLLLAQVLLAATLGRAEAMEPPPDAAERALAGGPRSAAAAWSSLASAASTSSPSRAWKNPASASGSASPGRAPASSAK